MPQARKRARPSGRAAAARGGHGGHGKMRGSGKRRQRQGGSSSSSSSSKFRFPSALDVSSFALELGMDLEFDSEQRWLVDQALSSALPPLWTRAFSPAGRAYYVRAPTSKREPEEEIVTWVYPLVPAYSRIFDNILADQLEAQKAALGIVS